MKPELRTFAGVQLRAAANFALEGVAAAYGTWSNDLGGFRETIQRGAFTRSLRAKADVKALLNHDANVVLGRVKNRTLELTDTNDGLAFKCQLDKRSTKHNDVYTSVQRGDIDACSFAFTVAANGDRWDTSGKVAQRTLTDVDLFDVSVVTYPAYPTGTAVQARNLEARSAPTGIYLLPQDWRSQAMAKLHKVDTQYHQQVAEAIGRQIAAEKE